MQRDFCRTCDRTLCNTTVVVAARWHGAAMFRFRVFLLFSLGWGFFDLFGLNLFISGNTAAVASSYLPPKRRTGPGHILFSGPDFRRKFSEIFFRSLKKLVVVVTPVQSIILCSDRGYQGESSFFVCLAFFVVMEKKEIVPSVLSG